MSIIILATISTISTTQENK
ncbi:TPA: hypothetical protein ACI8EM_004692 [Escherichia coli]